MAVIGGFRSDMSITRKYEGRSWTKCSTRRFVMAFRRFVVAFPRFGTPILLVDSLFSEVDSANCQFDSSSYELSISVCRFVVSSFRYGISSFRCGQAVLAATFDLAAFLVSMIAPVKNSVNHLRILPSIRITGKPKHVFAAIFVRDLPSI